MANGDLSAMAKEAAAMGEKVRLTDGQLRALKMIAHAANTRTRAAYVGQSTEAFDHCVRVNANAVRSLERMGLVETWMELWASYVSQGASKSVGLTPAGRAALAEKDPTP